jgi:DNA modification methylase
LGDTYAGSGSGTTKNADTSKYVENSKQVYVLPNGTAKASKFRGTNLNKSLLMIPERFAIRMIDAGWILRNQIIWHKPNQMPSSATDRFTVDFEKIFFFVKQPMGYYFEQQLEPYTEPLDRWAGQMVRGNYKTKTDQFAVQERNGRNMRPNPDGKNMRTVWSINTEPFPEAHFATYPEKLVKRMIEAGCPENGLVLDPFMGAGTTAVVAKKLNRNYTGFELNPKYKLIAENRLIKEVGLFL